MKAFSQQMSSSTEHQEGWKRKLVHELTTYWLIFAYLSCFFGVFAWYRRLILAEYEIGYVRYGAALIEALVLAKVIMIGDAMRLGKRMEKKPLAYATLYKTVIFGIWVAVFKVLEDTLIGVLHGKGLVGEVTALRAMNRDAMFAEILVTLFAFVPFFAFRELSGVLGPGRIRELFFHRSAPAQPEAAHQASER